MSAFFDTSVLLPVFQGEHVHHKASVECVAWHDRSNGCCAAHSLAELNSTFTRLPTPFRKTKDEAMLFIENVRERLATITLTSDEYVDALRATAKNSASPAAPFMTPCSPTAPSNPVSRPSTPGI